MEDFEKKLLFINSLKRMYRDRFQEELHVDYKAMKGLTAPYRPSRAMKAFSKESYVQLLKKICKRKGANIGLILSVKGKKKGIVIERNPKEMLALHYFSRTVLTSGMNVSEAARSIGKDRTMIYYYADESRGRIASSFID